jgi:hypothetical protein
VIDISQPTTPFKVITEEMFLFETAIPQVYGVHTALTPGNGIHFDDREETAISSARATICFVCFICQYFA